MESEFFSSFVLLWVATSRSQMVISSIRRCKLQGAEAIRSWFLTLLNSLSTGIKKQSREKKNGNMFFSCADFSCSSSIEVRGVRWLADLLQSFIRDWLVTGSRTLFYSLCSTRSFLPLLFLLTKQETGIVRGR